MDAWFFGLYYVVDDKINQHVRNELDASINEWELVIWLYVLHLVQYFFAYAITKEGYSACRLHYESVNVNLKYSIPFIFSKLNKKGNKI